jgi:hypothetical protein
LRAQTAFHLGNLFQDLPRPFAADLTGISPREMAGRPLDERGPEDLFECHELAADGSRRNTQLTAGSGQISSIRNLDEDPHRREFIHGLLSLKSGESMMVAEGSQNRG